MCKKLGFYQLQYVISNKLYELVDGTLAKVGDNYITGDTDSVSPGLAREDHIPDQSMIDVLLVHPSVS
jgi:hypothetical protein